MTNPLTTHIAAVRDALLHYEELKVADTRAQDALASLSAIEAELPLIVDWQREPPCKICGYNGVGYYNSDKHKCAAIAAHAGRKE